MVGELYLVRFGSLNNFSQAPASQTSAHIAKAESCPHCGMRQIILNKDLTVRIIYARSSVRSRDGPPFKSMGYSLGCSPFFFCVGTM